MIDNRPMCQAEFIRQFNDENRPEFNPKLFERNNQDILDYLHGKIEIEYIEEKEILVKNQ